MPVIHFDPTYPQDLSAMAPSGLDEPDSIEEVPVNPGTAGAFDPAGINKVDLWQKKLIQLVDIPVELWWQSAGKSLVVRREGKPSPEGYTVEFQFPTQLELAQPVSISGDGEADPIDFNGTAPIILVLKNVKATSLLNARDFSIAGDIIASAVSFDATGSVVLQTSYNNVVPDDKLPSWISNSFTVLSGDINNLSTTVSNNYTTLNNAISSEASRASNAENALNAALASEITRSTNADADLQTQISSIVAVPAGRIPVKVIGASHVCTSDDLGKILFYDGTAAGVLTIPYGLGIGGDTIFAIAKVGTGYDINYTAIDGAPSSVNIAAGASFSHHRSFYNINGGWATEL